MSDSEFVEVPVTLGYDVDDVVGTLRLKKDAVDVLLTDETVIAPAWTIDGDVRQLERAGITANWQPIPVEQRQPDAVGSMPGGS